MRFGVGLVAGLTAVTAAVWACTPSPVACTEIGSSSGISVTVTDELASGVTGLRMEVCWDGTCQTKRVELSPGADTVPLDCPMGRNDSACAATAVPNGMLVGFVEVPDLPPGRVQVSAELTRNGTTRRFGATTLAVSATYPNGPDCPAGGNQATVEVRPSGLIG